MCLGWLVTFVMAARHSQPEIGFRVTTIGFCERCMAMKTQCVGMMRLCGCLTLALLLAMGAGCSNGSGDLPKGEADAAARGSVGASASPGGGINRREFAGPATTTKTFLDYLKPTPITCSPLSSATWGVAGVLPRPQIRPRAPRRPWLSWAPTMPASRA
jgi:hypothetical protein